MAKSTLTLSPAWMNKWHRPGIYWCKQNPGLGCRVGKTGTKAWIFQRASGSRLTLGRWPNLGVRAARARAADLAGRRTRRRPITLGAALDLWAERCRLSGGSEITIKNRRRQFEKHLGDWMDKSLSSITYADLVRLQLFIGVTSKHAANDILRDLGTIHRMTTSDPWPGENIQPLKIHKPSKRRTIGDPAQ